ncbi:Isopenicillin N synthase-like [Parasponia andersonii]|uniref:Isopenicillin N synthase-like n=1 Tax=Parasponia andersonii TaxID=3476 RepID=A0A2P5CG41_PARAD|nr:Isopenicillin N synthase-like [Parasponia andersonii]
MADESSSSFTIGKSAQERGLSYVPECYKKPTSHGPISLPEIANVPVVDLAGLKQVSEQRSLVIEAIRMKQVSEQPSLVIEAVRKASRRNGFFQVSFVK